MSNSTPDFQVEPSSITVDVRIIDSTTRLSGFPTKMFFESDVKGFDKLTAVPAYSFLIEHPSGRKLLFDLGLRKDWKNLAPVVTRPMTESNEHSFSMVVEKGVREILEEHKVPGESIEGIVWSHWHLDHTGDPSTFEKSTALIVGPGFKEAFVPGYPASEESPILETDYAGRELREINFTQGKKVGRFDAFDYFGDGSYYLLDSPGHAVGHLCGLARVTTNPDSFIFMGGDACHHGGEFRPSAYLPLPESISPHPLDVHSPSPCAGALFEHLLPGGDRTKAFFTISKGGISHDADEAQRTIEKVQVADAQAQVLVVIAHDETLLPVLDFFPKYATDFASKNWVDQGRWGFLKDFRHALE